ncbi:MAG: TolC family protein [Planctomycetes bacterium]|nr:TolC family protein [Planctomycetota bacterium]
MKANLIYATAMILVALTGCATVNPRADFDRAARAVDRAVGIDTLYRPDDGRDINRRVTELLDGGLSAEEAVQVALLNNPRLQAALFKLGISRAEVVQSGLFTNPTLAVSLRWPDGGGLTNLQAGLAQNIAELWQISYRKQAAERDLDRTVLEVAREASVIALDARTAYWRAVRAHRDGELARENLELAQTLHQLVISRREAGAGSDVDVNLAESQLMGTELWLRNAALATVEASAALATHLGNQSTARRFGAFGFAGGTGELDADAFASYRCRDGGSIGCASHENGCGRGARAS